MKNVEIKICISEAESKRIEQKLWDMIGHRLACHKKDYQIDYYFNVSQGRLKLRVSEHETSLVGYDRAEEWPKVCNYHLFRLQGESFPAILENAEDLRQVLDDMLGIWAVVEKERDIFEIGQNKFHLDKVKGLDGHFFEIEVRDEDDEVPEDQLRVTLDNLIAEFGVTQQEAVNCSYSDLLIEKQNDPDCD